MIRPICTARSNRASSAKPDAINRTSPGIANCAIRVKTIRMPPNPANASRAKVSGSRSFSSFLENIGTKAVLNAPSAKKRRNMLGRAKATRNASATGPAPRRAAIRISRPKPNTRLASVHPPTVRNADRSRIGFMGGSPRRASHRYRCFPAIVRGSHDGAPLHRSLPQDLHRRCREQPRHDARDDQVGPAGRRAPDAQCRHIADRIVARTQAPGQRVPSGLRMTAVRRAFSTCRRLESEASFIPNRSLT